MNRSAGRSDLRLCLFLAALLSAGAYGRLPIESPERESADALAVATSARLQEVGSPYSVGSAQSPANETDPLFPVLKGGKWGYIDKTGKMVIQPVYYYAYPFVEGLAMIQPWAALSRGAIRVQFIDKKGRLISPQTYAYAHPFSDGLALVAVPDSKGFHYIDKAGKVIDIPYRYGGAGQFSEGLANIEIRGKWGHIDKTGQIVIQPQFAEAYGFSEGLADVKVGGKWGYIDRKGNMVISPQYDATSKHAEGLAAVKIDGKWGYIDKTGKMISKPQYDKADTFSDGLALVKLGSKWGYIDPSGGYVWEPTN